MPEPVALVAQTDEATLKLLKRLLQAHRFKVVSAGWGPAILRSVLELKPVLLLIDLSRPSFSRLRTVEEIRSVQPDLLILGLTGPSARERDLAGPVGCNEIFTKPIRAESLGKLLNWLELSFFSEVLHR